MTDRRDAIARMARAWRERFDREKAEMSLQWAAARTQADACARHLARRHGVDRLYLLGSLARGSGFHAMSDMDLAVAGLPADQYLRALDDLHGLADRDIDLIRLEEAPASMTRHILDQGVLLYERPQAPTVHS